MSLISPPALAPKAGSKPWVIYTRVSSEEQTLGHSLDNQATICRDFASRQAIPIAEVITDAGLSGKNMSGRPGIQRMIARIRAGEIGGVLISKLDRLTRSLMDMLTLVQELETRRVELQCVLEPLETRTPTGKLMFQMRALFAEYERAQIAERQKISYRFRKLKGLFPGGSIPAGFHAVGEEGKRRLEVHPTWGPVVATCWTMVESGCSIRECATYLQEQGVPSRAKGRWSTSTVSNMLAADWPLNGLVSKEQHERVRALLSLRKCPQRHRKHGPRKIDERPTPSGRTERVWPLQGLTQCAHCGAALVGTHGNGRGGRYFYLQCSGRAKHATGSGACTAIRLPADAWEKATIDALRYLINDRTQLVEAYARETADWSKQVEPLKERQRTLTAERDEATAAINRLISLAVGSELVQRAVAEQLASWQQRLEAAVATLSTVELELRSLTDGVGTADDLLAQIRQGVDALAEATPEEQKVVFNGLLAWVKMGKGPEGLLPLELGLRLPWAGGPGEVPVDGGTSQVQGPGHASPAPSGAGNPGVSPRATSPNTEPLACTRGSDTHTTWRRRADSNRRYGFRRTTH